MCIYVYICVYMCIYVYIPIIPMYMHIYIYRYIWDPKFLGDPPVRGFSGFSGFRPGLFVGERVGCLEKLHQPHGLEDVADRAEGDWRQNLEQKHRSGWFGTWLLWLPFHINGKYNPNPIDELHDFSRWWNCTPTRGGFCGRHGDVDGQNWRGWSHPTSLCWVGASGI